MREIYSTGLLNIEVKGKRNNLSVLTLNGPPGHEIKLFICMSPLSVVARQEYRIPGCKYVERRLTIDLSTLFFKLNASEFIVE